MRRRKRAAVSLSSLLVSFWGLQNDRQVTTTTVAFSSARPVRPQSDRHVITAVAFSSLRPAAKQRGRLTVSCRRQANSPATLQLLSARQELLPRRFGSREGRVIGFRRKLSESPTDVKHGDEFPGDDQEIAWKDDDVEDLTDNLLVEEDESSMGAWVPVGSISCMEGLDPLPVEIMGRQFVVWRGADGRWSVLKDECPHRMVPLSQGRVDPETGCLECAFHGWQFGTEGTLVRIPHLEAGGDLHAESRSVEAFATHVTGDLLWTFLPTLYHGESFPRAVLPEDYYHGLQSFVDSRATYHTQEMPFSFDFLIEKYVKTKDLTCVLDDFRQFVLFPLRFSRLFVLAAWMGPHTRTLLTTRSASEGKRRDPCRSGSRSRTSPS
jgi:nitrite reductase/ring-hydroxylating ferredoxin subunit